MLNFYNLKNYYKTFFPSIFAYVLLLLIFLLFLTHLVVFWGKMPNFSSKEVDNYFFILEGYFAALVLRSSSMV